MQWRLHTSIAVRPNKPILLLLLLVLLLLRYFLLLLLLTSHLHCTSC